MVGVVGIAVGSKEGYDVEGAEDGRAVGVGVGDVGMEVGCADSAVDGAAVGIIGDDVGMEVGCDEGNVPFQQ